MQNEGGRNIIPTGWKYKKIAVAKLAKLANLELTLPSLSSLSSDFLSKNARAILAISPKTSISPCKNLHEKSEKLPYSFLLILFSLCQRSFLASLERLLRSRIFSAARWHYGLFVISIIFSLSWSFFRLLQRILRNKGLHLIAPNECHKVRACSSRAPAPWHYANLYSPQNARKPVCRLMSESTHQ